GEKLFEELQHVGETHQATEHPEIMRFVSTPPSLENIERALQEISSGIYSKDANTVKKAIKSLVPEYTPHLSE
ncbi:MAG: hypothetical protein LBV28_04095, partial [Puniceicoccales bacterium]|nr:hypothetical protein [Puniceicoccales bacterium]